MNATESPYKPLASSIVFLASVALVIAGLNHHHNDVGLVVVVVGLVTGLIAMLSLYGGRPGIWSLFTESGDD